MVCAAESMPKCCIITDNALLNITIQNSEWKGGTDDTLGLMKNVVMVGTSGPSPTVQIHKNSITNSGYKDLYGHLIKPEAKANNWCLYFMATADLHFGKHISVVLSSSENATSAPPEVLVTEQNHAKHSRNCKVDEKTGIANAIIAKTISTLLNSCHQNRQDHKIKTTKIN